MDNSASLQIATIRDWRKQETGKSRAILKNALSIGERRMKTVTYESPAAHSYLGILQNVISRMAADSGSCKTWCITLVSAIIVVVATQGTPNCVWLALIPVLLFLFLDSYYLGMERTFRHSYNNFIKKLQSETAVFEDTFIVKPISNWKEVVFSVYRALDSFSVWSFYGMLVLVVILVRYLILRA